MEVIKMNNEVGTFGNVTGSMVGVFMKEATRRAIVAIRRERFVFESQAKPDRRGQMTDVVTSADKKAQQIYLKLLTECFPGFGIVGEEDNLSVPCTVPGRDIWFSVDPLDGTKAYVRRQSNGIGTQIALIENGRVIAACVGDVMTQEIFYFRPGSGKTHRLSEFDNAEELVIDPSRPLSDQKLLLRSMPHFHSSGARKIIGSSLFKASQTADGSIGLSMAQLWKGEVGGKILERKPNAPWDWCPIVGISEHLGFQFFTIDPDKSLLTQVVWESVKTPTDVQSEILVLHASRVEELSQRFAVKRVAL